MTRDVLPDKPSDLILVALHDLELCEADPDYEIDMSMWHNPDEELCLVCLAGSVMAKSLGVKTNRYVTPIELSSAENKLYALNNFREGSIPNGLRHLGIGSEKFNNNSPIADYHLDHTLFKNDMLLLAFDLDGVGL